MNPRHLIAALFVLAAAAAALYVWDRATGDVARQRPDDYDGPVIAWSETVHDFGTLFTGQVRSHEFTFTNEGTAPLRIVDTKKECGCTTPKFDRRVLEPGQTGRMTVAFSPPIAGVVEKRIWVYTNDDYARESIVRLRGSGRGTADLDPHILDLDGAVIGAGGLQRELRLTVAAEKRILAVTFNCENPWMSMERTGPLGSSSTTLALHVARPPAPIRLREQIPIFITAEDEEGKRTTFGLVPAPFQVTGAVRPDVWAEPSVLHFGAVATGETRRRTVRISGDLPEDGGTPRLTVEGVEGVLVERVSAAEYALELGGDGAPRRLAGRAVLEWDGGRVVVPLQGWSGS